MINEKKYAFFTIDAESFLDTECICNLKIKKPTICDSDMLDGINEYLLLLEKYGVRATIFLVSSVAEKIPNEIKNFISRGHKIALHGLNHAPLHLMSEEQFLIDTKRAKEQLEEKFGVEIMGFRAPFFSIDDKKLQLVKDLGFRYDASYSGCNTRHAGKIDLSNFNRVLDGVYKQEDFYEFKLVTRRVFGKKMVLSGGGFARIIPEVILKSNIRRHLKKSDYYTFYLHPFETSKQDIPIYKELKAYDKYYLKHNVKTFLKRIENIIKILLQENYTFSTMEDFVKGEK